MLMITRTCYPLNDLICRIAGMCGVVGTRYRNLLLCFSHLEIQNEIKSSWAFNFAGVSVKVNMGVLIDFHNFSMKCTKDSIHWSVLTAFLEHSHL